VIVQEPRWTVHLTASAEADFQSIIVWTSEQFGVRQAAVYAETLSAAIAALSAGPTTVGARKRGEIGKSCGCSTTRWISGYMRGARESAVHVNRAGPVSRGSAASLTRASIQKVSAPIGRPASRSMTDWPGSRDRNQAAGTEYATVARLAATIFW